MADASSFSPPKDNFHAAYLICFLLGAGYLVPWNAFITAIDYFENLYPNGQVDRVFSIVYMIPAVAFVFLLTFFGRRISASLRVNAGLLLFTATLVVVPVMNVLFIKGGKGTRATYAVTIAAGGLNGVADALMQGSVVGLAGELPPRYMQAVMAGTGGSGVLVSVLRIISKAVMPQTEAGVEASAYLYFIVSALVMILCIICYNVVGKLPVMQYYKKLKSSVVETASLLGHDIDTSSGITSEANVKQFSSSVAEDWYRGFDTQKPISYLHVWKKIQGYALSVAFIYVVTLSIFPGHITEDLESSFFGDWYAVLLTLCYNAFDLIGKFAPLFRVFMIENKFVAIGGCMARALFFLLFYLCLHGPKVFQTDTAVMISTCLLGLTNGYFTTIVMVLAPKSVPLEEAEVAGFIMVMFLLLGLALGAILEWVWVL